MNMKNQNLESLKDIHQRFSEKVKVWTSWYPVNHWKKITGKSKVSSLVTDSRRVTPGSAFIAIRGFRTNGAEFLDDRKRRRSPDRRRS